MPDKILFPKQLLRVSHYLQPANSQPAGGRIAKNHQAIEIITGGRGWVRHEGDWAEVKKGDFLWHDGGENAIGRSDPDDPYRCLAIYFEMPRGARRIGPRFLFWPDMERLPAFVDDAVGLFVDERFSRELLCMYLYGLLLKEASVSIQHRHTEALPAPVRRMVEYIEENYHRRLELNELATVAGWSAPHLHARVEETLNTTPHALLIARRLRAARELLYTSNMPLKQIAAQCGFTHASALCLHFRRATGTTPAAFRRRALGK